MSPLTSQQRVIAAARRQTPDRIPRYIDLEDYVYHQLCQWLALSDLTSVLKNDIVFVGPVNTRQENDYSVYFTQTNITWDEWGRGRIWDNLHQYAAYFYPLERADSIDEILQYPWPDLEAPYRYAGLSGKVDQLHAMGLAVSGGLQETIFEIAWQLRSMSLLFEDILHQDEKAAILLDQITDRRVASARAYAYAGVDILSLGDDVSMQTGLMMSRKMWRAWFKPRLARVIQAARQVRPDILIEYHSDGKINDLIEDLIEIGADILNPVQPECVDYNWVKSMFGERLSFSGGLGVQSVLPFGTPDEVRSHTHKAIEILGAGGGYIVGPSHVVERDVSMENILAMLEAIDQYGKYE
jgi:uroporphyrinogen decarboxylase